jgi:hypothetical protein
MLLLIAACMLFGVVALAGCGDSSTPSAGAGAGPGADPAYDDYAPADDDALDDGQVLYEDAFSSSYAEACEWIFADSPDGYLYYAGDQYEQSDCELAEPSYPEWDGSDDPEAQGQAEGWVSACEETFSLVGDDLYYGDDEVVVSQDDCEFASPY